MGKILLISSPKGGTGKSVLARHFLVSARQAGLGVVGLDYDRQGTFEKWGRRRVEAVAAVPDLVNAPVYVANLQDWRAGLERAQSAALVVIDTPPSVEDHLSAISSLAGMANLVVVPCQCTQDDIDSVRPWVEVLGKQRRRVIVVLNRANRRTTSFGIMRGKLLQVADVCPVEIPPLEDVHVPSSDGLTLHDFSKSRGHEPFKQVWSHVSRAMELT